MSKENEQDLFMNTNLEFVYYFPDLCLALLKEPETKTFIMVKATEYGQTQEF